MKDLQEFIFLAIYISKFNNLKELIVNSRFENTQKEKQIKRTLEQISSYQTAINSPLFNLEHSEEFKVHFKVSNKVAHGMFLPIKDSPGLWLTSDQTLKALKKDIFTLADDIDELKSPYQCHSCKSDLDRQFWHFCPYCAEGFDPQ